MLDIMATETCQGLLVLVQVGLNLNEVHDIIILTLLYLDHERNITVK